MMENESSDITVHDAASTLRRDGGIESGQIVEWLCGRPVHQGRATRPHSGIGETHHLEQRNIIGRDASRRTDTYKIFVNRRSCQGSADIGEQRHLTSLVPFGKILGRARYLGGRYSFNGSNKAEIEWRLQAMAPNWQIVPQPSSTHGPEAPAKQTAAT